MLPSSDPLPYPRPSLASAVAQLLADQKLTIPVEILRGIGWVDSKREAVDLVADLDEPGHLTLYLRNQVVNKINSLARDLERSGMTEEAIASLQVLHDRYQATRMDGHGHRLRFTEHILIHMGIDPVAQPGLGPWFFLQGKLDCVEVMTLDHRNRRSRRWLATTSLPSAD
jgi:hypothetical protein